MRNLVEIFNTNDLRWLLEFDILPEDYPQEDLVPVFDDILIEYEELRGDRFYTTFLEESDYAAKDAGKLVVLRGCYTLLECGYKDQALNLLNQVKIKADTLDKVDFEMKKLTQRLQIKAMKSGNKPKEKTNFGKLCAQIKTQLPNSDPRNATVAEFIGYEQIIKENTSNNG